VEKEALATLIVRLGSPRPQNGELCWHRWDQCVGAHPHGLGEDTQRSPMAVAPFKRLPGDDDWPYFNAHVRNLLFPPAHRGGGRWLCCPDDLYLDLRRRGGPRRVARIDLLERLSSPLDPGCAFGLIHLSLQPPEDAEAPDSLWWGWAIRSTSHKAGDPSHITLRDAGGTMEIGGPRPVRALVEQLFGDPHRYMEQSLYTVLMAQYPPVGTYPDDEDAWRRALAKRRGSATVRTWGERDQEREDRQTIRLAGATGLVLGNCTAFTLREPVSGVYARNLRSYWTESILFGVFQQECLEDFQARLAEIGDPLKPDVEALHRDWLSFRNLIWWSQLSTSTDIPQEIVSRLRNELGTERLFTDLEGDIATYSEHQHRAVEDRQAAALANLQVYGSGLLVLSTLATMIGLVDARGGLLVALLVLAMLVAAGVSIFVRTQLRRS